MVEVVERVNVRLPADTLEQLRSTREKFLLQVQETGASVGNAWLEGGASYEELERLWAFREELSERGDYDEQPLGAAEVYFAMHPQVEDLHDEATRFWRDVIGIPDELQRNQKEFLMGFIEAAVGAWPKLKEQLG